VEAEPATRRPLDATPSIGLSVILPAYNEAALIRSRLRRLRRHLERRGDDWEIIVVDDGSNDGTGGHVATIARDEPRVRLVVMPRNRGKGAALARGMQEARGAVLVATDADLSYSLADLDAAVSAVESGADAAAGNRRDSASRINLPLSLIPYMFRRWVAGAAFGAVVRFLFGPTVADTQCGLKAFSRRAAATALPRVRTRRFLVDIELLLAVRGQRLRIVEVPVHLRYLSGRSSVRMIGGLPRTLWDLARIKAADLRGGYG